MTGRLQQLADDLQNGTAGIDDNDLHRPASLKAGGGRPTIIGDGRGYAGRCSINDDEPLSGHFR
jgi:hypothetical protein